MTRDTFIVNGIFNFRLSNPVDVSNPSGCINRAVGVLMTMSDSDGVIMGPAGTQTNE